MIVGIVALFTVLFFGGAQEYFFIEKLEKGVKKYVVEKDRSKEILIDLKESKSMIKAFNKDRKGKLSDFFAMNLDRNAQRDSFNDFFDIRVAERLVFQDEMIAKRLSVVSKIEDDEWSYIISLSDASVEKKVSKLAKKGAKDPFESVIKTINAALSEQGNQAQAVSIVQNFKDRYMLLLEEVNSVNTLESDLLIDKYTKEEGFKKLAAKMNRLRDDAFQSFVDLHFDMKEITTEDEWSKVMKSINNVID